MADGYAAFQILRNKVSETLRNITNIVVDLEIDIAAAEKRRPLQAATTSMPDGIRVPFFVPTFQDRSPDPGRRLSPARSPKCEWVRSVWRHFAIRRQTGRTDNTLGIVADGFFHVDGAYRDSILNTPCDDPN